MPSRASRNNNPGNIEHGGNAWHGMSAKQTDPRFVQFTESKWGLQTIPRIIRTYSRPPRVMRGTGSPIDTLAEIITTWAPPKENDTAKYIRNVSKWTGFKPDQVLDLKDPAVLHALTAAIVRQESPDATFTAKQIAEAVKISAHTTHP